MARKYRQRNPKLVQRFRGKNEEVIVAEEPVEEEELIGPLMGDINQDGVVNVTDMVDIVQYILGNTELTVEQISLGDVNQDGLLNIVDLVGISDIILQGEE